MKQISTLLTAAIMLFMISCNNNSKTAEEKTAPAPAKASTNIAPYQAVLVQHTVQDYDKWHPVFASSDSIPKSFGLTSPSVGRGLDDDKMVIILTMAADIKKAHDFAASPALKEAMKNAGVSSAPAISYLNVTFDDTSHIPQQERLMVTHHVKDFDIWKKAFDAEGDSVRAANGLVERFMARNVDDANTVTIFFAITDMAKAKARANSDELKKIMTDAGVDGPPQITWFKWVN